jgi:hypothetical protein
MHVKLGVRIDKSQAYKMLIDEIYNKSLGSLLKQWPETFI